MEKVIINESGCKGCGLCVSACPKKLLEMDMSRVNAKGYNPVKFTDKGCISCAFCAFICPDLVLTINKESKG